MYAHSSLYCRFGTGYTLQVKVSEEVNSSQMETQFLSADPPPYSPTASTVSSSSPPHYPTGVVVLCQNLTTAVKQFICESFPGANLIEEHQVCLRIS